MRTSGERERTGQDAQALKRLLAFADELAAWADQSAQGPGITGAQFWALSAVVENIGIRVSGVAAQLAIHRSTASNLLDSIEQLGLIEKRPLEEDLRGVALFPTKAGQALYAKTGRTREQLLAEALQSLAPEEQVALEAALGKLTRQLRKLR